MARNFNGTSDYMSWAGAVRAITPATMACWFRAPHTATTKVLMQSASSSTAPQMRLSLSSVYKVQAATTDSTPATSVAITTTTYNANQWHHACAVFRFPYERRAYLDAGGYANSTATRNVSGIDTTLIGSDYAGTFRHDGDIAEAAIWWTTLDLVDIQALAAGYSPLLVRPEKLLAYWPLLGYSSPELSRRNQNNPAMTLTGTTVADHPRIIYPSRPKYFLPPAAASGSTLLPKLMQMSH